MFGLLVSPLPSLLPPTKVDNEAIYSIFKEGNTAILRVSLQLIRMEQS